MSDCMVWQPCIMRVQRTGCCLRGFSLRRFGLSRFGLRLLRVVLCLIFILVFVPIHLLLWGSCKGAVINLRQLPVVLGLTFAKTRYIRRFWAERFNFHRFYKGKSIKIKTFRPKSTNVSRFCKRSAQNRRMYRVFVRRERKRRVKRVVFVRGAGAVAPLGPIVCRVTGCISSTTWATWTSIGIYLKQFKEIWINEKSIED